MSAKKTSGALMTSLVLHGVAVLILGVYLVTQTPQFKDLVGAEVLNPREPPKPQVRKPVIRQIKPTILTNDTVVVEQVQVQPRVTTAAVVRTSTIEPQTVLEFSNKAHQTQPTHQSLMFPRSLIRMPRNTASDDTDADLPVSDAPGALAFSGPVASAPSAGPSKYWTRDCWGDSAGEGWFSTSSGLDDGEAGWCCS